MTTQPQSSSVESTPTAYKAYQEGWLAGYNDEDRDSNPYDIVILHDEWDKGWQDGHFPSKAID